MNTTPGDRAAVWQALSELFLDTALDDADIQSIARRLRASGMPPSELERIYEEEVAPVCWRNLTALPGGVWNGFEPNALQAAIGAHTRASRRSWRFAPLRRLMIRRWTAGSRADWLRVRDALERPS